MRKQDEIKRYLATVESATINEIYENVSFGYYCNANKHLGEILSRMVKKGTIERVKKGVFKLSNKQGVVNKLENIKEQKTLFE